MVKGVMSSLISTYILVCICIVSTMFWEYIAPCSILRVKLGTDFLSLTVSRVRNEILCSLLEQHFCSYTVFLSASENP